MPHTLKVLTWNTTGESDFKRDYLRDCITDFDPDIVILQELAKSGAQPISNALRGMAGTSVQFCAEGGSYGRNYAVLLRNGYAFAPTGLNTHLLFNDAQVDAALAKSVPSKNLNLYRQELRDGKSPGICDVGNGTVGIQLVNWHVTPGQSYLSAEDFMRLFEASTWYTTHAEAVTPPNLTIIGGDLNVTDISHFFGTFEGMSQKYDHVCSYAGEVGGKQVRVSATGHHYAPNNATDRQKLGDHVPVAVTVTWG